MNYKEDNEGNLVHEGRVVIPANKRQKAEVYSRVVGYLRPVENWNEGKKSEFSDRKTYKANN